MATAKELEADRLKLRLALQQKALEIAEAQAKREYESYQSAIDLRARADAEKQEDAARAAQYKGFSDIADLYTKQGVNYGTQFDKYAGRVGGQRESALAQLAASYASGQQGITAAQEQLLKDLTGGQSYANTPLVELGQIANPLLGGLAAEGASSAGVEQQSAQDAQMAAQLAALTRGSVAQLNTGEQNYLNALRNAGAFASSQAQQGLSSNQAMIGQGIRSKYDDLAQQIAQQRLQAIGGADVQAAEARASMGQYSPIARTATTDLVPFDYEGALERARLAAMKSLEPFMPKPVEPTDKPVKSATSPKKNKKLNEVPAGKKRDPYSGAIYDPSELT